MFCRSCSSRARTSIAWASTGFETFDIVGIGGEPVNGGMADGAEAAPHCGRNRSIAWGNVTTFEVMSRIHTPVEVEYYRNGGILRTVLRQMMKA